VPPVFWNRNVSISHSSLTVPALASVSVGVLRDACGGPGVSRERDPWHIPFRTMSKRDPFRGLCRAGSLTGAVHLSNGNAGVLRRARRGRKPRVEQKGKSSLDSDFQYEYEPRKRGLSILSTSTIQSLEREVSEKLPQG
jgi:hypothetical protein